MRRQGRGCVTIDAIQSIAASHLFPSIQKSIVSRRIIPVEKYPLESLRMKTILSRGVVLLYTNCPAASTSTLSHSFLLAVWNGTDRPVAAHCRGAFEFAGFGISFLRQ